MAAAAGARPAPLDRFETAAAARALGIVEAMPRGRDRAFLAYVVAGRLIERGQCAQALPILERELAAEVASEELEALAYSSARDRDPACMRWTAVRIAKFVAAPGIGDVLRHSLEVREAILFNLSGTPELAPQTQPARDPKLAFVRPARLHKTIALGNATLDITTAGEPTLGEELLIEELDLYRGTPWFKPTLDEVARLAPGNPKLLTPGGWADVAIGFLRLHDEATARAIVEKYCDHYYTFEGLEAERAIRDRRYDEAGALMAGAGNYVLHHDQLSRIIEKAPRALLPALRDPHFWEDPPGDTGFLLELLQALDRIGARAEANEVAREILRRLAMKGREPAPGLAAEMEVRLGRLGAAKRALAAAIAAHDPDKEADIRSGILTGLVARAERKAFDRELAALPAPLRPWWLASFLSFDNGGSPDLRVTIALQLARFLAGDPKHKFDAVWMDRLGSVETRSEGLIALARTAPTPVERGALAVAAATGAWDSRKPVALALADEARRQFGDIAVPHVPVRDLTRIYWLAGKGDVALDVAGRGRRPADRVIAYGQILWPKTETITEWRPNVVFSPIPFPKPETKRDGDTEPPSKPRPQ